MRSNATLKHFDSLLRFRLYFDGMDFGDVNHLATNQARGTLITFDRSLIRRQRDRANAW